MRPQICKVSDVLLQCSILCLVIKMAAMVSVARPSGFQRQRRSLLFPYGFEESYLEFIFGVGLPMNLPHPYAVTMSFEIRADYDYPVNSTDFTNPTLRQELKEKEGGGSESTMERTLERTRSGGDVTRTTGESGGNPDDPDFLDDVNDDDDDSLEKQGITRIRETLIITEKLHKNVSVDNTHTNSTEILENETNKNVTTSSSHVNESKVSFVNVDNGNANITLDKGRDTHARNSGLTSGVEGDEDKPGKVKSMRKRDTGDRSTRWRIYHVLEMAGNNLGMDGRACLLRSICDAAATPLHHQSNGLVGELLHVLLTPSTTDDDRGRYLDNEFRAAELLGRNVDNDCQLLYPECDVSFLDIISRFDL